MDKKRGEVQMKESLIKRFRLAERNSALDLIRIFATVSVICVHFFYNIGFYQQIIEEEDSSMFLSVGMRTFFMVCVPLFIVLTGYLMNKKELSPAYYKGILHTLGIYVIVSVFCLIYKGTKGGQPVTAITGLQEILNFKADSYSWYIEMYIGLFLLIPFLNLIYNHIGSRRGKQMLIATFFVLSTLPSICNVYGIKIVPAWWGGVWPVLYYFIGCYIREYPVKLSWFWHLVLLAAVLFASTKFNCHRSMNKVFEVQAYDDWFGWQNVLSTTILFSLLNKIRMDKLPVIFKGILYALARLSLGIYLASWIADQYVYPKFKLEVPDYADRLPYFGGLVVRVLAGALLLSLAAELIYFVLSQAGIWIGKLLKRKNGDGNK